MAQKAEYPYDEYALYVVTHKKEGRRMACLVHRSSKLRTTISYARYLMSVHLGRLLSKEEHVDHIDGDRMHDTIDNLQVLSQEENRKKYIEANPKPMYAFTCPVCGSVFYRDRRGAYQHLKFGKVLLCSRECTYKRMRL